MAKVIPLHWHVRKDDFVEVMTGKDKGKRGKILRVHTDEGRIVVEKVHMIKRATRPSRLTQQGGIIEREGKIHVSNVMPVCTRCDRPVRVGKKLLENGKKVRVCRKCGEAVGQTL
ncbi:MAG: 50S ribosomal protein L24 [Nitrospinae bacterium]|jgi:large subunit ribosomal protein L24|nr:50S ribosomal protein L24 [Nitrospinota bacterium]